jgi:hypothetical protein
MAFRSKFLQKRAYGYTDQTGVTEGSANIAEQENAKQEENINDTAQPQDHHETPDNPLNCMRDVEAERDFPSLSSFKDKRVNWPARTR